MTAVAVVVSYVATAKLGMGLVGAHPSVTAVWPPAGIALAAVFLCGNRMLPAVALGAFLANITTPAPLPAVIGITVGNTLEAFIGAALLRRVRFRSSLERLRDVVALVGLAGAVSTAVGATVGILSLLLSGALTGAEVGTAWRVWWLGDLGGVVIVGGALLAAISAPWTGTRRLKSIAGLLLIAAAFAGLSVLVLRASGALSYLVFPGLLLLALVYRARGAALGGLIVAAVAVWLTARGHGPFRGAMPTVALARAQTFATVSTVAAFLVAAARSERDSVTVAEGHFRTLFETAPYGRVVIDESGTVLLVNAEAERLFGAARDQLIGTPVRRLVRPRSDADQTWYRESVADAPASTDLDLHGHRSDGSEFPVEVSLTVMETDTPGGRIISLALRDVTARRLAAEALAYQATHDALTGLPNRTLFLDRLEHALARARRGDGKLAVVFLDLDDFKLVNDSRGHDSGDLLLAGLTPRLSGALRPGDTIGRFGGDEFVVLCEDLGSEQDATAIAQRIVDACAQPMVIGGYEHVVTVSAGVVVVGDPHAATASNVLRDADAAMYRAKAGGSGRVEVFDERIRARLLERIEIESSLRRALGRGELRLVYQPVISLAHNEVVGAEALLRWLHPQRGMLAPAEFLEVAESSGLIIPIGLWVIEEACRQATAWRDARPGRQPIRVSVNLSPRQVANSDTAASVAKVLRGTGLDPGLLDLEITEGTLLAEEWASAHVLRRLKDVGVRLILDDFGTGFSSPSYLRRFTIDALKIDRSFVDGLGRDAENVAIVNAMLSMADALDVGVSAEGVETREQLARLRACGCGFAQGYLFARPASAEWMSGLLAERINLIPGAIQAPGVANPAFSRVSA